MSNNLLSIWHASCEAGYSTPILPDGCRDLIFKVVGKEKPEWFVSPLFNQSESVHIKENSTLVGFRLRPGVEIKKNELISHIEGNHICVDEVQGILDDFISLDGSIEEALGCLASEVKSIKQASGRLGVSVRTLQRLVFNKTRRTPGYWLQLARVRKAARCLHPTINLAHVAEIYGFSDQSHMNREFQRWFKLTPIELLKTPALIEQLNDKAYC